MDEPWLQARPEEARRYGLKALDRALEGVTGATAVHICFGYAQMVKSKPSGYSFLPELAHSQVQQISIEAAQPKLDLAVLTKLASKTIILGVLDLSDPTDETADTIAARIRAALHHVPPERIVIAPDCGLKYLPREIAFGKMRAMVEGATIVRRELAPH
jgi:5-methyltetrahydropteroyltriglutamate--homocysteine methyltransferase